MKPLTQRQLEALRLVAEGKTHKESGAMLGISRQAVVSRMKVVFKRLGAINSPQAVANAFRMGILVAVVAMICGASTPPLPYHQVLRSPKDSTAISRMIKPMAVAPPPTPKTVTLSWSYPVGSQTSDMIFVAYHTTNLSKSLVAFATTPGTNRSMSFPANKPMEFFSVTASNKFGESKFATK